MKSPIHSQLPSDQDRDSLLQSVAAIQQICRSHLEKKNVTQNQFSEIRVLTG